MGTSRRCGELFGNCFICDSKDIAFVDAVTSSPEPPYYCEVCGTCIFTERVLYSQSFVMLPKLTQGYFFDLL